MLIGEAAERAGASARALRHYEDAGLLVPARTAGGYREYDDADVARAAVIKTMTAAGVGTDVIRRYLDCVRAGELELCPELLGELREISEQLARQQAALAERRARLATLSAPGDRPTGR